MVVVAIIPNSHKEFIDADTVAGILVRSILKYCQENAIETPKFVIVPVGDGGEGTIDAIFYASEGGKFTREFIKKENVVDPLGNKIESAYLSITHENQKTAFIEMARPSGLYLIPTDKRNPLKTTSYGTGELILDAHEREHKRIIIGVGGAGSHDVGVGMAQALGVKFIDKDNNEIKPPYMDNESIERVERIELGELVNRIAREVKVQVFSDVENTLLGEKGAAYTFGRQKGATEEQIPILERNSRKYADLVEATLKATDRASREAYYLHLRANSPMATAGKEYRDVPYTGAAGGLPYSVLSFLKGQLRSGGRSITDFINLQELIKDADLVITSEGRVDDTTFKGKAVQAVGDVARLVDSTQNRKIPVYVVCGCVGKYDERLAKTYIDKIFPASPTLIPSEEFRRMEKAVLRTTLGAAGIKAFEDYLRSRH